MNLQIKNSFLKLLHSHAAAGSTFPAVAAVLPAVLLSALPEPSFYFELLRLAILQVLVLYLALYRGPAIACLTISLLPILHFSLNLTGQHLQLPYLAILYFGEILLIEWILRRGKNLNWEIPVLVYCTVFSWIALLLTNYLSVDRSEGYVAIFWIAISTLLGATLIFQCINAVSLGWFDKPNKHYRYATQWETVKVFTMLALAIAVGLFGPTTGFYVRASTLESLAITHKTLGSQNKSIRNRIEKENRRHVQLSMILNNARFDSDLESISSRMELKKIFPAIEAIDSLGGSGDTSDVYRKDPSIRHFPQPNSAQCLPIRVANPAEQCCMNFVGNYSFIDHKNEIGSAVRVTTNLLALMPTSDEPYALINAKTGETIYENEAARGIDTSVYYTLQELNDLVDDVPILIRSGFEQDFGLRHEESLNNLDDLKLITFASVHESLGQVLKSMLVGTMAFYTVCFLFITFAWIASGRMARRTHRQLAMIDDWFKSPELPLQLEKSRLTEYSELTRMVEQAAASKLKDIRTRAELSRRLYAEHSELRQLINATDKLNLVVLSESGLVILVNSAAAAITGLSIGERLNGTDPLTKNPDQATLSTAVHDIFIQAGASGSCGPQEVCVPIGPSGQTHFMMYASSFPSVEPSSGETRNRFLIWFLDIEVYVSARRKTEHDSRLALLGETVAGVAHEINQPLNTILLAASNAKNMLYKENLDQDSMARKFDRIILQVQRASKLIKQMKHHGKASGDYEQKANINQEVREALDLLVPQLRMDGISLSIDIDVDENTMVLASPLLIQQVLTNILINARDAIVINENRQDDEVIGVQVERVVGEVHLSVKNRGPDIPDDIREKIFLPFFSTKNRNSESGVGLGLSICSRMVSEVGGALEVASEEGITTFTMRLKVFDEP